MPKYRVPILEEFEFQPSVSDKDLITPPSSPSRGVRYLLYWDGLSGAWSGRKGSIAMWDGTQWIFVSPRNGMVVFVSDEQEYYVYSYGLWCPLRGYVLYNLLNQSNPLDVLNLTGNLVGRFRNYDISTIQTPFNTNAMPYYGGVLTNNNVIYLIPYSASQVGKIVNGQFTTIGSTYSGSVKWAGGVLAPNGKIYCIPCSASSILVIDPQNDTTYTFGSFVGSTKWYGGVLGTDGKIYGIPRSATSILEIDPLTDSATTWGSSNSWRYSGALAPNGKIYSGPFWSNTILEIDFVNKTTREITLPTTGYYIGTALAWNGEVFFCNYSSTPNLVYSPQEDKYLYFGNFPGSGKWGSAISAPNGMIYFIPANSNQILEIDPVSKRTKLIPIDSQLSSKFFGGVVDQNGNIYLVPWNENRIFVVKPNGLMLHTWTLSNYVNKF